MKRKKENLFRRALENKDVLLVLISLLKQSKVIEMFQSLLKKLKIKLSNKKVKLIVCSMILFLEKLLILAEIKVQKELKRRRNYGV